VLLVTLRISLFTAALAALLGYPVAMVMVRSHPAVARIVTFITIAPLIVSVVVRSYGWQLILGNGPTGLLNWALMATGIIGTPLRLLYSETAVVIGSLHVFLPMMVLPLASALARIDINLEEAARTLGMPAWRVFHRITLPLSLPGLTVGFTLVFSLTAGSFVTPAMLGGTNAQMLGNLIDQQITAIYDWAVRRDHRHSPRRDRRRGERRLDAPAGRQAASRRMSARLTGGTAWLLYPLTAATRDRRGSRAWHAGGGAMGAGEQPYRAGRGAQLTTLAGG
jgi:ABC-type molybdate transport system permease subunit